MNLELAMIEDIVNDPEAWALMHSYAESEVIRVSRSL